MLRNFNKVMAKSRSNYRKYNIDAEPWIKVTCAAFNHLNPESIIIRAKAHVVSDHTKPDYSEEVYIVNSCFNKTLHTLISETNGVFSKQNLSFIELSPTGLANNKSSTLKYDIFLKPLKQLTIDEYLNYVTTFVNALNKVLKMTLDSVNIKIKS